MSDTARTLDDLTSEEVDAMLEQFITHGDDESVQSAFLRSYSASVPNQALIATPHRTRSYEKFWRPSDAYLGRAA